MTDSTSVNDNSGSGKECKSLNLFHLHFELESKGGFTGVETLWIYYKTSVSWPDRNLERLTDGMMRIAITIATDERRRLYQRAFRHPLLAYH
jgi:branched-subunit amino acid aminotransferase/4-amino-4-deoxychorismate lyase